MLYQLLYAFRADISALNVTRYITFRTAAASLSAVDWVALADDPEVDAECRRIWDSLEPEERADLGRVRLDPLRVPTAEGLRRLERRGLVQQRPGRSPELFSPVFERCLATWADSAPTEPAAPITPTIELVGPGRQVRVAGTQTTTLLAPEYEILKCLLATQPTPCGRVTLIEAMRQGEQVERSERATGNPVRRLAAYVQLLRGKLGPAGRRVQPAGDGFRLADE